MKPLLPFVALLAGLSTGCVDDRGSLEAFAICGMTSTCTFSNKCDTVFIGAVKFNKAAQLQLLVQLNNQSANNADPGTGRVNTNDAHVTAYKLEYSAGGPPSVTLNVGNQVVPAAGSELVLVYAAKTTAPNGNYTVKVSFIGYYDNGSEFQTPPFPIALDVDSAYAFGCPKTGDKDVCPGTGAQSDFACGTP
jgi:hypothetical protein